MTSIQFIIKKMNNIKYQFCTETFKNEIKKIIISMFTKLNNNDINILHSFTTYLIDKISIEHFFENKTKYYMQWKSNNNRDIKSIVFMLLPYINDSKDKNIYNKLNDLQELLYIGGNHIDKDILNKNRNTVLDKNFKFSNFALGLLPLDHTDKKFLLNLEKGDNNDNLIHTIIHHNFISLVRTIKIVANKLYINWINTQPISINNYKDSKLYVETEKSLVILENIISNFNSTSFFNFITRYKGLYLGDFYNTIRINLYQNMKKIKWVLFNIEFSNTGIYMIQYLDKILNLNNILNYESYDQLTDSQKNSFQKNLSNVINNINNQILNYSIKNLSLDINLQFEQDIFKNLIAFFINNYKYSKRIISNELKEFIIKEFEEDNEFKDYDKKLNKIDNISKKSLIDAMKYINNKYIDYLWDYLKEITEILKSSYYNEFLITKDENNKFQIKDYYYYKKDDNTETNINLKNIYNIAKSLSHESNDNNWEILPENYISLKFKQTKDFFSKIFNIENNWLSLRKNLTKQSSKNLSTQEYISKINDIKTTFNTIWKELIWKSLIKKGILSEFKVNLDITDESNIPRTFNDKKKYLWNKIKNNIKENRDNFNNSYYYLTNNKYKELNNLRLENFKETFKEYDYLDTITDKKSNQLWYTFYAMDWMAQINFFNHYINHQIIFVTGSTGTGKSTQVPKLIMYALKMYDYKNNGKITCTQPRIPPTEENTIRISNELGVPIKTKSKTLKSDVNTENYYLQYKHSESQHTKDRTNKLLLKVTTDGTLYNELLDNPIMKEKIPNGKIKDGRMDNNFGKNNYYDVIIVDEAHEHNTNMDLIITQMRNTCFYNNSVKLIIISATMDNDEPIYRNYFRLINDNLVYPLKIEPLHPITNENNKHYIFPLYSIYLDRRFHISPPGQTTLFKITDIYNNDIKYKKNDDKYNSILSQKKSYQLIIDICKRTTNGQILLFSTGQKEILEAVKYLNNNTPENTIAIPYFGKLHPKYKEIISKIDIKIKTITNKKHNIYFEWGVDYIDTNNPEGNYTRAIIIATNVAEASITIPNLKYVIDNGYAKVNKYDENTQTTELTIEKISESSRIQRRGRVGRISSGTVYYMYKKGERENIKPKYKVTQENFSKYFVNLASDNNNFFWYKYLNLYYYHYFQKTGQQDELKNNIIENRPEFILTDLNLKKIWQNIKYQKLLLWYDHNDNKYYQDFPLNYEYFSQEPYFDDIKKIEILDRPLEGYIIKHLIDEDCRFYIIHPYENLITKNIANEIIEFNNIKTKKLEGQYLFYNILKLLQTKMFYINISGKNLDIDSDITKEFFVKTKFYKKVNELNRDIMLSEEEITTLLIAKGYNILDDVVHIIAMTNTVKNSVINLAMKGDNGYLKLKEFYNLHKNDRSDLLAFHKIITNFKNTFKNYLKMFNLDKESSELLKKSKNDYNNIVKKFIKKKYTNDPNPANETYNDWNILNKLKNNNRLNSESGFSTWLYQNNNFKNNIYKNINKYNIEIDNWCKTNYINSITFKNYLYQYVELALKILTLKKNYDDKLSEKSSLEWITNSKLSGSFTKSLNNNNIDNKIINSFLYGYSKNIAVKLDFDRNKYNLFTGGEVVLPKIGRYYNSLCKDLNSILFYININTKNENKINILTKIDSRNLSRLLPMFFNSKNIKYFYIIKDMNKKYILKQFFGKVYNELIYNIKNNFSFNYFILNNTEFKEIQQFIKKMKNEIKN
jgi:hypothetical protein